VSQCQRDKGIKENNAARQKSDGTSFPVDLNRRASVVRQNVSNRRRKVIHASARHDDAVAAAMSFFGDAQEFPAIVLAELHIEMFALNLQFFRLDDVIHFSWRRRLYRNRFAQWKQNSRFFLFVREIVGLGS
jgi:hypothetical protein